MLKLTNAGLVIAPLSNDRARGTQRVAPVLTSNPRGEQTVVQTPSIDFVSGQKFQEFENTSLDSIFAVLDGLGLSTDFTSNDIKVPLGFYQVELIDNNVKVIADDKPKGTWAIVLKTGKVFGYSQTQNGTFAPIDSNLANLHPEVDKELQAIDDMFDASYPKKVAQALKMGDKVIVEVFKHTDAKKAADGKRLAKVVAISN